MIVCNRSDVQLSALMSAWRTGPASTVGCATLGVRLGCVRCASGVVCSVHQCRNVSTEPIMWGLIRKGMKPGMRWRVSESECIN